MAVGSFSAGLSGLATHSTYLGVIGNNLANINTIGFKASTLQFSELVSQRVGSTSMNPTQVGLGVGTGAISPVFSQGSIDNAREPTYVAIQGSGFFVVKKDDTVAFTRAGDFSFNSAGALATADGWLVQGYTQTDPATGEIIASGELADVLVPPGILRAPTPTTSFSSITNLDADAAVGDEFSTSVEIFDSLGGVHTVTVTFTNTAPGAWDYSVTVPGEEVTGGTAGTPEEVASGDILFDSDGALDATNGVDSGAPADVAITTPTWTNGAAVSTLSWDILDSNDNQTLTGYAAPSATSSKAQNGKGSGQTTDISIAPDGTILAAVSGSASVAIGQLALANFNNPKGLVKLGGNRFIGGEAAGLRNIGVAGVGGRGTVIGSALEGSNVDIAVEFTQMILAQRGYQANAKTITVSDEMLLETLQLKR